jgi:starvation-inducible outer membrane lipoprotein
MRWIAVISAVVLSGCASLPDTIQALSKDQASFCVVLDATLYGKVMYCRTNTHGMASLGAQKDAIAVQHSGAK